MEFSVLECICLPETATTGLRSVCSANRRRPAMPFMFLLDMEMQ